MAAQTIVAFFGRLQMLSEASVLFGWAFQDRCWAQAGCSAEKFRGQLRAADPSRLPFVCSLFIHTRSSCIVASFFDRVASR